MRSTRCRSGNLLLFFLLVHAGGKAGAGYKEHALQNIIWDSRSWPEANPFQARWKPVIFSRVIGLTSGTWTWLRQVPAS